METKLIDYAMNDDAKSFRDQLYAEIQAKVLDKFEEKRQEVAHSLIAQEAKMNPMDPKEHSDEAEDKALVKKMVKKNCLTKEETESLEEKKWIAGAIKHPGALHKELGVPEGEKIPQSKLKAAAKAGGKEGKRARLAMTLSKFHKEEASMEDLADALYETPEDVCDELINEVLSKDATAGDWIHDFVHSKNPKFEGKSKEMRKKMALAAYYSKNK